MIHEDIKALVHGEVKRLGATGMEIHYPGTVSGRDAAAHDAAMVLSLLDGIVVCDAPCGVVRSGDSIVLEQRWRTVDPHAFEGREIAPPADVDDASPVESIALPPPPASA